MKSIQKYLEQHRGTCIVFKVRHYKDLWVAAISDSPLFAGRIEDMFNEVSLGQEALAFFLNPVYPAATGLTPLDANAALEAKLSADPRLMERDAHALVTELVAEHHQHGSAPPYRPSEDLSKRIEQWARPPVQMDAPGQ